MKKANYCILKDSYPFTSPLIVQDIGPWDEFATITNDAERIVEELHRNGRLPSGRRLFYYDSENELDEICIDEYGKFAGFNFLSEDEKIGEIK